MSFARQLATRPQTSDPEVKPEPFDASAALSRARMARATSNPKPWAQAFMAKAEDTNLPVAVLNDIVTGSDTLEAALATMTQKLAAGHGHAALARPAQADAAQRIIAAHAKAHRSRTH